jgi:hypothetical protein
MNINVTCHTCGAEWMPQRGDYVRGTWRTCPDCRPGGRRGDMQGIRSHKEEQSERRGAPSAPERKDGGTP